MGSLENLLSAMDELVIARNVGMPHDEARMNYSLDKNTVKSFDEFSDVIADYCNYHVSRCVLHGGFLSRTEAAGKAKEILEQQYRRQGGNIMSAYTAARDGIEGGLRTIIDRISEQLKEESVEHYIRDAFDKFVDPASFKQKVDIIRQLFARFGHHLSSSIRLDQPERYASNFEELIRAYVESLRKTSSIFRRL